MTFQRFDIAQRSGGTRRREARRANDRIADKAERLRFVSRVPMLCECGDPDCHTVVMVSLEEYHAIRRDSEAFLTAPGHSAEDSRELRSA
jgi:hypothetical protein